MVRHFGESGNPETRKPLAAAPGSPPSRGRRRAEPCWSPPEQNAAAVATRHPPHPAPGKARRGLANPTQLSTRPTALPPAPQGSIAKPSNGSSPPWGGGQAEGEKR